MDPLMVLIIMIVVILLYVLKEMKLYQFMTQNMLVLMPKHHWWT